MAVAAPQQGAVPSYPQHANVYIRNISPLADENTIRAMFEPYGAVVTMKLVRSKVPGGRSYAFVNYQSIESAHNAIVSLNGFQFDDGVLEVKSANTDAQFDKPAAQQDASLPNDNLYITNLPHFYTEEDLISLFQPYGTVVSCKVLNKADNPLGSVNAMVRMSTVEEATKALQGLAARKVPGGSTPVAIKYADTPEQRAARKSRTAAKLPSSRYQPYDSSPRPSAIPYPPPAASIGPSGYGGVAPGGYALPLQEISFNQPPAAGVLPLPTYPNVDPNLPPAAYDPNLAAAGGGYPPASASVYIKNLPDKADKLYLYETFAPLGAIRSVNVMTNEATGLCSGVGFVNFVESSDAIKAVNHFNGATVEGKVLYVSIQPPKPFKSKQFGASHPAPAPAPAPAPTPAYHHPPVPQHTLPPAASIPVIAALPQPTYAAAPLPAAVPLAPAPVPSFQPTLANPYQPVYM